MSPKPSPEMTGPGSQYLVKYHQGRPTKRRINRECYAGSCTSVGSTSAIQPSEGRAPVVAAEKTEIPCHHNDERAKIRTEWIDIRPNKVRSQRPKAKKFLVEIHGRQSIVVTAHFRVTERSRVRLTGLAVTPVPVAPRRVLFAAAVTLGRSGTESRGGHLWYDPVQKRSRTVRATWLSD